MKKKSIFNFIVAILFIIAIISFIMYFRYLFTIKSVGSKVTELMEVSLVRYRNIGVFCLAIAVFLLFIKSLYDFFRVSRDIEVKNENGLERISYKKNHESIKYSFDENSIINDLLTNKVLSLKLFDSNIKNRVVKFKKYNSDKKEIEFYDLSKSNERVEEKVIVNEVKYDTKHFIKCFNCEQLVAKDAPICVHCGKVLKEEKVYKKEKQSIFNPIKFALNMILILLCIILILLCLNKITRQSKINRNNLNINRITNIRK